MKNYSFLLIFFISITSIQFSYATQLVMLEISYHEDPELYYRTEGHNDQLEYRNKNRTDLILNKSKQSIILDPVIPGLSLTERVNFDILH